MTPEVYLKDSERTMAKFPHGMTMRKHRASDLAETITALMATCRVLDGFKKHLYYGKDFDFLEAMNECRDGNGLPEVSENMIECLRKLDERETDLLHAALGKLTEAGEVMENVFKYVTSPDQNYDHINTVEEVGDGWWYDAILLRDANETFEGGMQKNIDKLRVRYPEKFDSTLAQNRDLEEERKTLE